jgi:restriction system protein
MSSLPPVVKGWVGETKSKLTQHIFLNSKIYHAFNNLIIQEESISTQIDHIVVSRYGIFVVETKNMDGWIFGNEKDERWTQTFLNNKRTFQNPLRQNYRHTRTLARYLGINHDTIKSVVVFWGDCTFKTRMPENVIRGDILGYTKYIKSHKDIHFTDDEVYAICDKLQNRKDNMDIFSGLRHIKSTKKRFESNNKCPRCGGDLVERVAKKGERKGQTFLGCSNYPRCNYRKSTL